MLAYVAVDFANKRILRTSWSSSKVKEKVRQCRALLSELEQLYILHLPHPYAPSEASYASQAQAGSRSALLVGSRPHMHARFNSMALDEFAALGGQEAEDEDEALRSEEAAAQAAAAAKEEEEKDNAAQSPRSSPPPGLVRSLSDSVFGRSSSPVAGEAAASAAALSDEEGDDMLDELSDVHPAGMLPHQHQQANHNGGLGGGRPSPARNLFPSSQSRAANPSVLGLSNHAFGHSLLCIFHLSTLFASLPLSSTFSPSALSSTWAATAETDPRVLLHRDLVLLASHELSPWQKLLWLGHLRRQHEEWLK